MKKATLALVLSIFTAGTVFPSLSQAQGPDRGPDAQWHQQGDRGNHGGPDRHDRHDDRRDHDNRGRPGERDRFSWNGHDFRRGHPMPQRFRGNDYRVNDWRARGLYEPPRGAHWAYVDGNYVLIAAATGVIAAILLGSALGNH